MTKTDSPKRALPLVWLCCMVYFMSYITRLDYSASLTAIVSDLNITKQMASIAVTGSFFTYGIGQVVSGMLGDRIKPRKLITLGLGCTSLINLAMAILPDIRWMTFFWCFNGFFQSMLWPPLVRLMAENMSPDEYARSVVHVNTGASIATILIYLMTSAIVSFASWRVTFLIAGAGGILAAFFWMMGTVHIREDGHYQAARDDSPAAGKLSDVKWLLAPILIAIAMMGILKDGVTTWMPTYIYEVFDLGVSSSILTTAILPVFNIICTYIAAAVKRRSGNELKNAAIFFCVSFGACLAILPLFNESVIICALLMAIATGCMYGVNLMLISHLPVCFSRYGKVSTVSGILNACTYIGSALSTYVFAVLSDNFGWGFTIAGWAAVAACGTIICALLIRRWSTFKRSA